jgi:hypothetical protein
VLLKLNAKVYLNLMDGGREAIITYPMKKKEKEKKNI